MSPKAALKVAFSLAALLLVHGFLVGARLIAQRPWIEFVYPWAMPVALLIWAQSERSRIGRSIAGLHGGIWFVVFGPLLVPYYLLRTWRHRRWYLAAGVTVALFSPFIGSAVGFVSGSSWIPPRYYQLEANGPFLRLTSELAEQLVARDFALIETFLEQEQMAHRSLPEDGETLYDRWYRRGKPALELRDPYTGWGYYYERRGNGYVVWSAGPDGEIGTEDDHWFQWPHAPVDMDSLLR